MSDESLRPRAEREAAKRKLTEAANLTREETELLVHELRVHQIELEMQNAELRSAQEALDRSRARYFDLFDLAPIGYVSLSAEGVVLETNLTAATLFGTVRAELVGKPFGLLVAPEDQAKYYSHPLARLATGSVEPFELRLMRSDRTSFWGHVTAVSSGRAEVSAVRVAIEDVSARVTAEADRERLAVALAEAQRLEAVGRLAGGLAHDINNRLAVIDGYAELALAQIGAAHPIRSDIAMIQDASRHAAELVRNLLAFARRQTAAASVIDLNQTVAELLDALGRVSFAGVAISWHPAREVWSVRIDPSQVERILANLCANARDATSTAGGITVATRAVTLDLAACSGSPDRAPGDYAVISVEDTGRGMDAETLRHAFEPFFTTKGVGPGLGMGLPVVHGIVKQNHGFVEARSQLGVGTRVDVYIPRCPNEA